MSWVMRGRPYSGTGALAERWGSPPAAPTPASPLLPFPEIQPWQVGTSSPSSASAASPPDDRQRGLQPEPSHETAAAATADEEQLLSMLSALRVAMCKKEAALVNVAGRLAEAQSRLQGCEAENRKLAAQVRDLQFASGAVAPERLAAAASVTMDGRLLAQARQELGREACRIAELATERDALQSDVAMLHQQLVAAAQAEAKERERLCMEATQSRLVAKARARQVEQLQAELQQVAGTCTSMGAAASKQAEAALAEAASAQAAATSARSRAAAAEEEAAELRQQLEAAQAASMQDTARWEWCCTALLTCKSCTSLSPALPPFGS